MRKHRAIFGLFALVTLLIVVVLASCITIGEKPPPGAAPGAKTPVAPSASGAPLIKSFSAGQTAINAGQTVQLTWEVLGTQTVAIAPVVGMVDAASSVLVTPVATTTYTLTATNAAGSSTASITITVSAAAINRPELAVTAVQLVTRDVYYRVKNLGNAEAKPCTAYLFVNGLKNAESYIEALAPGQERQTSFSNYTFPYLTGDVVQTGSADAPRRFTIKVCADVENAVVESDESNNCMTVIWGEKFVYPFVNSVHQAAWTTGYGVLKLPLPEDSATGAALAAYQNLEDNQGYGSVLVTVPQQVNDGWISGKFGEFYTDEFRRSSVREITVPDLSKFTAKVGFSSSTPPGSKARFIFGTVDQSGTVTYAQPVTASMDGKLDTYEVNLNSVAGQKMMFILRVEVIGSADKVRAVWVDPTISQP